MDRMKEAEAREVIRWEAEQHVPFDMENVELDFQILDPDGDGLQMSVLLVAAKRELVETKVSLLADAGLEPGIIDVDAFALHNAFELNHPDAMHGVVGLVNIGHEVTNVNILEDGVPVLTRDLQVGTRRFREDLQRERGMLCGRGRDRMLQRPETHGRSWSRSWRARGEELAVGIERAAAFLQSASRSSTGLEPPVHHGWRGAHSRPQPRAGRPAAPAGAARQPDRTAACRRRRAGHDGGRRGGTAVDAADRPRAPFRRVIPGAMTP